MTRGVKTPPTPLATKKGSDPKMASQAMTQGHKPRGSNVDTAQPDPLGRPEIVYSCFNLKPSRIILRYSLPLLLQLGENHTNQTKDRNTDPQELGKKDRHINKSYKAQTGLTLDNVQNPLQVPKREKYK